MIWSQIDQSAGCFGMYEGIETQSTQNTRGIDVFGTPHGPVVNRGKTNFGIFLLALSAMDL